MPHARRPSNAGSPASHRVMAWTWPALAPASADASFRRYLRVAASEGGSLIVMDAPPPQEDVRPFVHVAGLAAAAGLYAPRVLEADVDHGFLLLTDLGRTLYLDALQAAPEPEADRLMRDALAALLRWQQGVPAAALPPFDEALLARELALFPEWCVQREFGVDVVRRRARSLAAHLRLAHPQRAGATGGGRARRLDAAQPDGGRSRRHVTRHPGLPGRGGRAHHLRPGLAAARRLPLLGRGAGTRLGGALVAAGAAGRPAGGRRLRRVLARAGMDGPAAPPQGAGHLLPPQAPRRQGALRPGPAALLRLRPARGAALRAAASRCCSCWSRCRAPRCGPATPSDPPRSVGKAPHERVAPRPTAATIGAHDTVRRPAFPRDAGRTRF